MWNKKQTEAEKEREAFEQNEMQHMLKEMIAHNERIPSVFGKYYTPTCKIYHAAKQRWALEDWKRSFLDTARKRLDKDMYNEVEEILIETDRHVEMHNYMNYPGKKLDVSAEKEKTDVDYVGKPLTFIPMTGTKESYEKTMGEVYSSQLKGQIERYEKLTGKHMSVKEVRDSPEDPRDDPEQQEKLLGTQNLFHMTPPEHGLNLPSYYPKLTESKQKEMNRMMYDMIEHDIPIPLAFAFNEYSPAVRGYRKVKRKWEDANKEQLDNTIDKEIEELTYCALLTSDTDLNSTNTAKVVAVAKDCVVLESYMNRVMHPGTIACRIISIGEAAYKDFQNRGYGLELYRGLWATSNDIARCEAIATNDTEFLEEARRVLVELEDWISSYSDGNVVEPERYSSTLQQIISAIPLWTDCPLSEKRILSIIRK